MERGEGSNQLPYLHESEVLHVMPLRSIPPISLNGEPHPGLFLAEKEPNDQDDDLTPHPLAMVAPFTSFTTSNNVSSAAAGAGPSNGPMKRGRGRPKGSKSSSRPFTSFTTSNNVSSAAADAGPSNGPVKRGRGRPKASEGSRKAVKKSYSRSITSIPDFQGGIIQEDKKTGNAELVTSVLMRFDAVRRCLCQISTGNGDITVALGTFKNLGLHTNAKKRIGSVPGIDVGDIFFCWGEMYLVGLHVATIGIEFMGIHENGKAKSLAISVVSSGKNVDETQDPGSLVYTGYGGTDKYRGAPSDQKLDRMNLALENAIGKKTVVRVVRAVEDQRRRNGRVYIYDGLYLVTRMWAEFGENGFLVYKFKLVREPGQKPAFEVWKHIEQWKSRLIPRPRIILEDISFGAEVFKIPQVNEVDDEKGIATFTYITTLSHWLETVQVMISRCKCLRKQCGRGDGNCLCVQRNAGELPYADKVLVARRPMIYECGSSCCCSAECKNKMIQNGLKYNLEVFKTVECGWGLRSWDPIRAGSFICEYAGEVIKKGEEDDDDDYIFDSSRVYNSLQWNYEHELVGEKKPDDQVSEKFDLAEPLVISAKKLGNVARFINHSCTPNVLWQPMKRENNGKLYIHIGLFALKHIPPMTELRFDYGTSRREGKKMCLCGSDFCRGSFG